MKSLVAFLAMILVSGCATVNYPEHKQAKESVVTMINAIDKKDWKVALNQFDESVFVDYSSMTGQPGKNTPSKDLVAGWQKLLQKAETHHMLTNFEVSASGQTAEVFSHVYASHTAKGIQYWDWFLTFIPGFVVRADLPTLNEKHFDRDMSENTMCQQ